MNATYRHTTRGAALAETAMVVSFLLILLFGMLQIVLIGYLQVAGDAAVFVAAHQYTLGVSPTAIASAENNMVPGVIATNVVYTPAPPDPVGSSADNVFNQIYGSMNQHSRTGGYTLVRPQNFTAYLNSAASTGFLDFPGFPSSYPINSAAVEGYYLMTNQQMDQFGDTPDNSSILTGSFLQASNASPFLPQSDAAIANMNTPPYYLPNPIMKLCPTPWGGGGAAFGTVCGGAQPWFLGLGATLEDTPNYNASSGNVGINHGDVFATLAGHQRIYANLIAAFPALSPTLLTADLQLKCVQAEMQNHANASLTAPGQPCTGVFATTNGEGYLYENAAAWNTVNAGSGCTGANAQVPLYYYDALLWWIQKGGVTDWTPHAMWQNEATTPGLSADAGNDGPQGPCPWGGASFALVYYWDQPNFPGTNVGAGFYPPNPTAGLSTIGDPGY